MQRERENAIIVVSSVFTISTTVGQVISIDQSWIQYLIVIPNILVWIYFFYIFFHFSPPLPPLNVISKRSKPSRITLRYVRTPTELDYVWDIDNEIYGDFNISKQTLYDWYAKYKYGTLLMFSGVNFIGYVGIYPLYESSFHKLRSRELEENKIGPKDICSDREADACKTWYFSGYALQKIKHSGTEFFWRRRVNRTLFGNMIATALITWSKNWDDNKIVEALSFSYPGTDAKFLKEIGFLKIEKETPKKELPLVYRTFSKSEIFELAESLTGGKELSLKISLSEDFNDIPDSI